MSNTDPVQIPVDLQTASIEEAIRLAEELDDEFKAVRRSAQEALAQATGLYSRVGGQATLPPFSAAQQVAQQYAPAQLPSAISPQFAAAMQAAQARQGVIRQSFGLFAQSPSFQAGTPQQMAQAFQSYAATSAAQSAAQQTQMAALAAVGAAAAPSMAAIKAQQAAAAVRYYTPPASPFTLGGAPSAAAANPFFALSGAKAAVPITMDSSLLQSLGRALSSANLPLLMAARSGLGALGITGGLATGILRGVGGLGVVGVGAAGIAGLGVAGAAFASETHAQYYRRQALLQGATYDQAAGTGGAPQLAMAAQLAGQGFNYDAAQANKTAVQLAMAGVPAGGLMANMANTFALGRLSGLGPDQIAPLTSALAVQGGMGPQQISAVFQEIQKQVALTGIPMARLIGDLKDLTRETGNASISVSGLAAVQRIAGNAINVGQLMAPSLGASGAGALTAAAALGVTPDRFMALQRNPAQMWDAMSRMVQQRTRASGAMGTMAAEQLLQSTGLVDWTGVGPQQQARLITLLRTGQAGQAQALAASLATNVGAQQQPMPTWIQQSAQATEAQTGAIERLTIALTNFWTALVTGQIFGSGSRAPLPPITPLRSTPLPGSSTRSSVRGIGTGQSYVVPNFAGSPNRLTPQLLQDYIAASNATGVPLDYLLAQGSQESGFNPRAVSKTGAQGIAQFMPATAKAFGIDPFNPQQAIMAQALYDKQLKQQYGTYQAGLNAYYGEPPATGGYGPAVINVALNLQGKLEVVDASGKIVGYVSIDQKTIPITHKPTNGRRPTGSTGWGPHHRHS